MASAYQWDSNWKILLLLVLLLPILLRLGYWQLERADEKRALQARYEQHAAMPALSLDSMLQAEDKQLAFRQVRLQGYYDNEHSILLDNQVQNGQVGYQLLSPFMTRQGQCVLINRGWIPGFADRRMPVIEAVVGDVDVVASVYVPPGEAVLLGSDIWADSWPLVVQSIDVLRLAEHLHADLFRYSLRLEPGVAGAELIDWSVANTRAEKHTGYAVQWFVMAFALFVFWLYASIRKVGNGQ